MEAEVSLRAILAGGVALALATAGGTARAQQHSKEYDDHLKQAKVYYDLAEWDKAVDEYKAAYAISQEAWLLYNIAQAYRLKPDCAMAHRFYKTYLVN